MKPKAYIFDIDGTNGLYGITNLGTVVNNLTNKPLKPYVGRSGYLLVCMFVNKKRIYKPIHRLVAQAFIPNPQNKPHVNHKIVYQIQNGVVINKFYGTNEAQRATGITQSNISCVCCGKRKTAGGYKWKYEK